MCVVYKEKQERIWEIHEKCSDDRSIDYHSGDIHVQLVQTIEEREKRLFSSVGEMTEGISQSVSALSSRVAGI